MTNLTDLKRTLNLVCAKNRHIPRLPDFFLMSDDERLVDPRKAVGNMPAGSAIIVRHRDPKERKKLAFALKPICRKRKVLLLIAEDIALAKTCHADGIHISERSIRQNRAYTSAAIRKNWLVSAAAHSKQSALQAQNRQVDAILLSPVFPTHSHISGMALGVLAFCTISRAVKTPVYALGGIDIKHIKRLKSTSITGIAGIGFISKILNI